MSEPRSELPRPIRVIVADDQASVREGLMVMLGLLPDIEVVAGAVNGRETLDLVSKHQPDAVLLDLHMPILDGTETTRLLTEQHPGVAIVILTTYADDASVLAAVQAGARSYLTKDADRSDIAHAIRSAASGLAVFDRSIQDRLLAAAVRGAPPDESVLDLPDDLPDGLTKREAEILAMIARGMSNPDIAEELYLSMNTVKSHVNRIFSKTGSFDRSAATRYAQDHGLVR
ncbi:MAG: response regulator transcription factor [Acidimicrobiales bacterium]